MNFKNYQPLIEEKLRYGEIQEASKLFEACDLRNLSRSERLLVANICRRIFKINLGLKILSPLIFSEEFKPTEVEIAEYSNLLTLNGSVVEALSRIDSLGPIKSPRTLLAKAWIYFGMWKYEDAIELLETYIEKEKDYYFQLAGEINLSEALCETKNYISCEKRLNRIIKELSKTKFKRLLANALHIQSMLYYNKGNIKKSQKVLVRGIKLFDDKSTSDKILFYRQKALNHFAVFNNISAIREFKKMALEVGAWDSLRFVDLEILKLKFNYQLYLKLYYGTPYEEFRNYLDRLFPDIDKPSVFRLGNKRTKALFLKDEKLSGDNIVLSRHSAKLLGILLRDLYSPLRDGDLFASLYPDEYYHFIHSPNRIKQAIFRLRKEIKNKSLPIEINCKNGNYSMKIDQNFSIVKNVENFRIDHSKDPIFERLRELKFFTRKMVMETLQISKATSNRLLSRYVNDKKIEVVGVARKTKYKVL